MARYVHRLVALSQRAGWQVRVISTPDGRKFIDVPALAEQTGHPVRSEFKNPGDPDLMPPADAIVVAPATVNTINKWACGIADTLALGLLVEAHGLGTPMVAMPYTNTAMAAHPAFVENLRRLSDWGVQVLFGDDVMTLPAPRRGEGRAAQFPWALALAALGPARCTTLPERSGAARHASAAATRVPRPAPSGTRGRLAPPVAPRPAPAILRAS